MSASFDDYGLSPVDITVLRAVADACYHSLTAHMPESAIRSRCSKYLDGKDFKKSLKKIHSKNLIIKHPTGGNTTFQLSKEGLRLARV